VRPYVLMSAYAHGPQLARNPKSRD
jgi:hypothetical protein